MYEKQFLTPINAADRPRLFLWKHVLNKMELTFAIELTLTFKSKISLKNPNNNKNERH